MSWPWMTIAAAFVLAVATPIAIIGVRHEIRIRRIRLIQAFNRTFGVARDRIDPLEAKAALEAKAPLEGRVPLEAEVPREAEAKAAATARAKDIKDAEGAVEAAAAAHAEAVTTAQHASALAAGGDPAAITAADEAKAAAEASGARVAQASETLRKAQETAAQAVPAQPGRTPLRIPIEETPSFEFVLSKYAADLDPPPKGSKIDPVALRALKDDSPTVDAYISKLSWIRLSSNRRLLWSSMPYMLVCFVGFLIALWPLSKTGYLGLTGLIAPSIVTGGALLSGLSEADANRDFLQTVTIAAVAFMAAYLFGLRTLVRAVAAFDLSAVTILRVTSNMLLSLVVAVILYRGVPALAGVFTGSPLGVSAQAFPIWLIIAFVVGFVPDSGLQTLLQKASQYITQTKVLDKRFGQESRSTPLEMIDGIDVDTRFRLEEVNINEVQNLACANPIMMHIETPFGIYETIDWVAQAQLCTVVGAERFLIMRENNIRTIFDLERAVLGKTSTLAMRQFVAMLLLAPTETGRTVANRLDTKFPGVHLAPCASLNFAGFVDATGALFCVGQTEADASLKHLVRLIVDDLHVHRLRQVWMSIALTLGRRAGALSLMEDENFYTR